ncbi:hypothetical protein CH373_16115 [Leptospira perolatii]|uniref:Uncharacterized protein n=1 Tax=Leptospira perolatii TaxID=2023191 RepID=A0A2M9ZJ79_9LEPT|nr:hypothetical protein CH360_16315 [Leptospira perolatii]PJZ72120.1 hypothetical protein CH373_16115 [Leptospira perolatii]
MLGEVPIPKVLGEVPIPSVEGEVEVPSLLGEVAIPSALGDVAIPSTVGDVPTPATTPGEVTIPRSIAASLEAPFSALEEQEIEIREIAAINSIFCISKPFPAFRQTN